MEQENNTYTGKICGNCDAFCECCMAGAENDDVACPEFDDSVLSQLSRELTE